MEKMIRVCAWCHPGDSIYAIHPEWRELGLPITHGICERHKDELLNTAKDLGWDKPDIMRKLSRRVRWRTGLVLAWRRALGALRYSFRSALH